VATLRRRKEQLIHAVTRAETGFPARRKRYRSRGTSGLIQDVVRTTCGSEPTSPRKDHREKNRDSRSSRNARLHRLVGFGRVCHGGWAVSPGQAPLARDRELALRSTPTERVRACLPRAAADSNDVRPPSRERASRTLGCRQLDSPSPPAIGACAADSATRARANDRARHPPRVHPSRLCSRKAIPLRELPASAPRHSLAPALISDPSATVGHLAANLVGMVMMVRHASVGECSAMPPSR